MKTKEQLEQQIEKDSNDHSWETIKDLPTKDMRGEMSAVEWQTWFSDEFKSGAKSESSKEYWQNGMYTEEQVYKLIEFAVISSGGTEDTSRIKKWFETNKNIFDEKAKK